MRVAPMNVSVSSSPLVDDDNNAWVDQSNESGLPLEQSGSLESNQRNPNDLKNDGDEETIVSLMIISSLYLFYLLMNINIVLV